MAISQPYPTEWVKRVIRSDQQGTKKSTQILIEKQLYGDEIKLQIFFFRYFFNAISSDFMRFPILCRFLR